MNSHDAGLSLVREIVERGIIIVEAGACVVTIWREVSHILGIIPIVGAGVCLITFWWEASYNHPHGLLLYREIVCYLPVYTS